MIQKLPRSIALVVIEHDMEVVFAIADRITVLHHGEAILSGTPEEIRSNEIGKGNLLRWRCKKTCLIYKMFIPIMEPVISFKGLRFQFQRENV